LAIAGKSQAVAATAAIHDELLPLATGLNDSCRSFHSP
jgi:hypothetical protein